METKKKIRQIVYLLHHHIKITKKLYNNLMKSLEKMGGHIKDNKLVIITKQKTIHFVIPKDFDNNLK